MKSGMAGHMNMRAQNAERIEEWFRIVSVAANARWLLGAALILRVRPCGAAWVGSWAAVSEQGSRSISRVAGS
jgi:hypothetical protein